MSVKFKEAKLIYMRSDQNQKLLEIKNEILEKGGDTSINEIVRDAIDILIYNYKSDIINRYGPIKLKKAIALE